jgi:hypothetical protein
VANNYTTSTDAFADISEGSYSTSDYPAMEGFVTAASRLIDLEVGRWEGFFYPTTDDVTRYYDGNRDGELDIDEFVSITSVSVSEQGGVASTDYTLWGSTDYFVAPYNYSALGKPITSLIVDTINGSMAGFYGYRKAVQVVGIPGYAISSTDGTISPPAVVALACRIQAVRWFMRAKGGYQDVTGTDETGQLFYKGTAKLDGDVKLLLHPLKLELDR